MTYNKTSRRRFTKRQREAFLTKHGGICHWCKGVIDPEKPWQIEHLVPRELIDGKDADDDSNLAPIHAHPAECHKQKTRRDIAMISKSNRIRKNNGLDPDKRKPRPAMKGRGFPKGKHQKIPSRPFPRKAQ